MKPATFLLAFLLLASCVAAAGIGVTPAELSFNIEKGKRQQRELTVYNLDDKELEFEAQSDAAFIQFYHEGVIEPESGSKITVEADATKLKTGKHTATIYITTKSNNQGVGIRVGTAIEATVEVFSHNEPNFLVGILISVMIVASGLAIYSARGLFGHLSSN